MFNTKNKNTIQRDLLALAIILSGVFISTPSYALWGEILGAVGGVVGTVIPVVGTTVGATIGAVAGGLIDRSRSKSSDNGSASKENSGGVAPTSDANIVRNSLQEWKENNQELYKQHRQLVDDILQSNEHQMSQLLQMQRHQLDQMVRLNDNQRRDFLAAMDRQAERNQETTRMLYQLAREGKELDYNTTMTLLNINKEEGQRHKAELDRIVVEYNAKVNAAHAERDAAVKKATNMLASLQRQLIMAQFLHVACSQAIDDYSWCAMIGKYQKNSPKCAELEDKKQVLCE